jgi:PhnB protein
MSKVSIYLNFQKETEAAIRFYETVFGTKNKGIMRFGETPPVEGTPALPEEVKNLVMHTELPIYEGYTLMASDAPVQFGFKVNQGNNVYIMVQPDTREETKKFFNALKEGGVVEQELQDMFWGDYYGSVKDKFGVQWMFNCIEK